MGIWLSPSVQREPCDAGNAGADDHGHPFAGQIAVKSTINSDPAEVREAFSKPLIGNRAEHHRHRS